MTNEVANDTVTMFLTIRLNSVTDSTDTVANFHLFNSLEQTLFCNF